MVAKPVEFSENADKKFGLICLQSEFRGEYTFIRYRSVRKNRKFILHQRLNC